MEWRLAEAKNKFSELVNRALEEGPQRVTRHKNAVIILSEEDYEKLTGARPSFKKFLTEGTGLKGIDIKRDRSPMRDVDL